jgi:hypothetical protein
MTADGSLVMVTLSLPGVCSGDYHEAWAEGIRAVGGVADVGQQ